MQYPHTPLPRAGSKERSAKARLDAEALFRPSPPTPEVSTAVVILKKRRSVAAVEPVDVPEARSEEVRAPRVHRIGPKEDEAALAASTEPELPVPGTGSQAAEPKPARRRRRLHGPVSILRPASAELPADAAAMPEQVPAADGPVSIQHGVGEFFFKRAASRQYAALLARIAKLQAEAEGLRKLEAAKAIEWIQTAIQNYGLTRQDLGFK